MPAMLRFDTLKFAKRLTDAGMDQRQAEALVLGLSEADTSELATKADIAEVKAEITGVKADIAMVKRDLVALGAANKTEIAELKAELFRFLYVQAMGVVGLTVGLTVALIKLLPS
jgi:hypothetical protein